MNLPRARQINRLCYILMLVYNVDSFTMVQMKLEESARNETRRCDAVCCRSCRPLFNLSLTLFQPVTTPPEQLTISVTETQNDNVEKGSNDELEADRVRRQCCHLSFAPLACHLACSLKLAR